MLWSPSEVLAYMKDEKSEHNIDKKQADRIIPTAPYGGFKLWPNPKEDFILVAENSEIHGPNPLFTIPELDPNVDLNLFATQILSADYQGLSNNKLLPGKNTQLLMPDIASDTHVAVVYFYLFDSEARGFIRPTSVAYYTADKNKLANLSGPILKRLTEVSLILQHFNISCTIDDLKSFKESVISASQTMELSKSSSTVNELLLQNIQEILDIVESYEGNSLYDKKLSHIMTILEKNLTLEETLNWIKAPLEKSTPKSDRSKLSCRPNFKLRMKDLYQICDKGVVLALYHLFLTHKYFRRKYENIMSGEAVLFTHGKHIHFGACVVNSSSKNFVKHKECYQNKCKFITDKVPSTFSLEHDEYLLCLDSLFGNILEKFINWEKQYKSQNVTASAEEGTSDIASGAECCSSTSVNRDFLNCIDFESEELSYKYCRHIVPLGNIWDILECMKVQNPGIEETFLKILKLFNNSQGLLFAVLTRSPIVIISSSSQIHDAMYFTTALSLLIPRIKRESIFVDVNRLECLLEKDFSTFAAVHICINESRKVEELIPIELVPKMCILNLKDCSMTAPSYSGRILNDIDQRLKVLPTDGPVFPILIGLLSEVELTINWWDKVTSLSVSSSKASSYVLSKGYTRSDMKIIQNLFKLREGCEELNC